GAAGARSQRSTGADRLGKNGDVTNAQARTAWGQMGATLRKPSRDLVGRQAGGQRPQLRPAGKEGVLNGPIVGSEYPIRAALHERVSEMLEPLGGPLRRARPQRRPEAPAGALADA